jgi:hypothetical protein
MIEGLRWVEIERSDEVSVRGMLPGWPECSPTYYKLQYLDLSGRWIDVEVE